MAATDPEGAGGRSLGYLYNQIITARAMAQELEAMWENDAPVAEMAAQASATEDRFVELRSKLFGLAETLDA